MKINSSLKSVALKATFWSAFDRIINQVGAFALLIYLSRLLTPKDFGILAILTIFIAISKSFVDSGFSQALIQKSRDVSKNDLDTTFVINLVLSLVIYFIFYSIAPWLSEVYDEPDLVDVSRVLFTTLVINSFCIVPRAILVINVKFKILGVISTIATVLSSAITILLVQIETSYWALVWMNVANSIITTILILYHSNWRLSLNFSFKSASTLFNFGSNLMLSSFLAAIAQNIHTSVIGKYFGTSDVGNFQQSSNYTNKLAFTLTSIIQKSNYPIMTLIKDDEARFIAVYKKTMDIVVYITFPFFSGFALISNDFVSVFLGDKWIQIVSIMMILAFAKLFYPIDALNLNMLKAKGRSDLFLRSDLMKFPFLFVLLFLSIPYGLEAVAWSQLIYAVISFIINAYYPGKLFGFGFVEQLRRMSFVVFSCVIMVLILNLINIDEPLISMIVKIITGIVVYVSMSIILKIESFNIILNLLKRKNHDK